MKPGLSGYQDQKNILQEEKTRDEYYKETQNFLRYQKVKTSNM